MLRFFIHKNKWWLSGNLVAFCLGYSFWPTIQQLVSQWLGSQDYSHGILILPIAGYLTWLKRKELMSAQVKSDWRGVILLAFAILVFIVGELGAELFTTRVSLLLFVIGLVWLIYGIQVIRILKFPLAFLFLMLPLPGFIHRNITFPLQLSASIGSVNILHWLDISAYREGNVIDIGFTQLQIVEACNGLRYILPLLTIGILFAYYSHRVLWKRLVLIFSTIPIAIFANVLRVTGTAWIGTFWGTKAADGFFHFFSGWAIFMVCLPLFVLLSIILQKLPGASSPNQPRKVARDSKRQPPMISGIATLSAMALILAAPSIVHSLGSVPPVRLKNPLSAFPTGLSGWEGKRSTIVPEIWAQVGGQEYVLIDYTKANTNPLNFYVAFYESQRKGGDFVHSPRLCLPGSGWFIEQSRVRTLTDSDPETAHERRLHLNEMLIQKDDQKQLVYFWYQGRSRNFTNEFSAKFFMVWDGLWHRRTDGALVRLISPISRNQPFDESRDIMDRFALLASQELQRYLP